MKLPDALEIFRTLEADRAWSQEEYEKGLKEAEEAGDEPMENPPVYDVRLDADSGRNYEREYSVRITASSWMDGVGVKGWQKVLDLADTFGTGVLIQNNGIELN